MGLLASVCVASAPVRARCVALSILLALLVIARVPQRVESRFLASHMQVVTTGGEAHFAVAKELSARAAVDPAKPLVHVADGSHDLRAAVALALVASGSRAEECALLWTAPVASESLKQAPRTAGPAFTMRGALPFEPADLSLRALSPPLVARPFELSLTCIGARQPMTCLLSVRHAGQEVLQQRIEFVPGTDSQVAFTPTAAGVHELELSTELLGYRFVLRGQVDVLAAAPVLLLDPSCVVAAAIRVQGVPIVERSELPEDLSGFAAIVLAKPLVASDQARLAEAVDAGGGLFCIGPGLQLADAPLQKILPLHVLPVPEAPGDGTGENATNSESPPTPKPTPPNAEATPPVGPIDREQATEHGRAEVDKRAIAMVLLVDRSGSMGTELSNKMTKMSYAKTSAMRTALALEQGDQVGIVTFGNKDLGQVELPMTSATDRAAVQRGIMQLASQNEATYLLDGLRKAAQLLADVKAAVKHIVVISDGEFFPIEELAMTKLAREMATQKGITLSIVSIVDSTTGPEFRAMAEVLTREGGGAFWPVEDPKSVPQFVSAEVGRALDRVGRKPGGDGPGPQLPKPEADRPQPKPPVAKVEPPTAKSFVVSALFDSPLLAPKPVPAWPILGGIIRAEASTDALVLLIAADGELGRPLLAYVNRGLGRVGAFAADLALEDSSALRAESHFPARLTQWIMALRPPLPTLPAELLGAAEVSPVGPKPSEAIALSAIGSGRLLPFSELRIPPPRTAVQHQTQVPNWAFSGAVLLLLLAFIEWWLERRLIT